MFDKLDDLLARYEEIMNELNEPTVTNNQDRFRKLMKEQSDLTPIVDAYTEYKKCKQDIEDSLSMLEEEKDDEMREMIKETLNDSKKRVEELEQELKILLLPKDPNDDKNVIVEIRAGAGGDEAAQRRVDHQDLEHGTAAGVAGVMAVRAARALIEHEVRRVVQPQQGQLVARGMIGSFAVRADAAHKPLRHHAAQRAGDQPRLHADVAQTVDR